jgi:hypothetical protein
VCLGLLSRGFFYRESLVEADAVDDGTAFEELLGSVDSPDHVHQSRRERQISQPTHIGIMKLTRFC